MSLSNTTELNYCNHRRSRYIAMIVKHGKGKALCCYSKSLFIYDHLIDRSKATTVEDSKKVIDQYLKIFKM